MDGKIKSVNVPVGNGLDNSGADIIGDITTLDYTPSVPANWPVVPTNAQDALDELAANAGGGVVIDPNSPIYNPLAGLNAYVAQGVYNFTSPSGIDSYVSSLLNCDGNILDTGPVPLTYTNVGANFAAGKFSQGLNFATAPDRITTPNTAALQFGSGDFTIDFWVKNNSAAATQRTITKYDTGGAYDWQLIIDTGNINFATSVVGLDFNSGVGIPVDGQFHHVAMVRNGNNFNCYIDGVQAGGTLVNASAITNNGVGLAIGATFNGVAGFIGVLDEIRISKGIARWTTNFTPPQAPYGGTGFTYLAVDVFPNGGLMLTQDGVNPSTDVAAQLGIKLDGASLSLGPNGLKVTNLPLTPQLETFVLTAPDIANGYVTLGNIANFNTVDVIVEGLPPLIQGVGYNFTLSNVPNTRVTLSPAIVAGLTVGQIIQCKYWS